MDSIKRKMDELGRITLPIEIREQIKAKEGDFFSIQLAEGKIILEKIKRI